MDFDGKPTLPNIHKPEWMVKDSEEVSMRDMGDIESTRDMIFNRVEKAVTGLEPVSNGRHTLRLSKVKYSPFKLPTPKDEKNAVLKRKSLDRQLRGTWELVDNETGDIVDKKSGVIARVPYLLRSGSFMRNGSKYTLSHQSRLKPGVFARVKENGEIEAHANVAPEDGKIHRYFLDPEKGLFSLRIGQAKIPLTPVLRALGATDEDLVNYWGSNITANHTRKEDNRALNKVYDKVVRNSDKIENPSQDEKRQLIGEAFARIKLDPGVMKETLGKEYQNINKDVILGMTKKLLKINRKEAEPDNRDNLAYQKVYGPEDLLSERIEKDYGNLRRQLLNRASFQKSLKGVPSAALTKQLDAAFLSSGLAQNIEEINPADILDKRYIVSRMGEGGIPSTDSIPMESRLVQGSHMGFVDPIRTPECFDAATEVFTSQGWVSWKDTNPSTEFLCYSEDGPYFSRADKLVAEPYNGLMYGFKSDAINYLVTPTHRVSMLSEDRWQLTELPAEDVFETNILVPLNAVPISIQREVSMENMARARLFGAYIANWTKPIVTSNASILQTLTDDAEILGYSKTTSGCTFVLPEELCERWSIKYGEGENFVFPETLYQWRHRLQYALWDMFSSLSTRGGQVLSENKPLLENFVRLMTHMGMTGKVVKTKTGQYTIKEHDNHYIHAGAQQHYVANYEGMVYCANVPGNRLFVRRRGSYGFWSGNSMKAGVQLYFSSASKKGSDNRVYAPFINTKTKEKEWVSPENLVDKRLAFDSEYRLGEKTLPTMINGQQEFADRDEVDYVLPYFENAFSPLGNLIPLKSGQKGHRSVMASRIMAQALPLVNREAPLVQSGVPDEEGRSYEDKYGPYFGAMQADASGTVLEATPDQVKIQTDDGKVKDYSLYRDMPSNRKTYLTQEPTVEVGQRVEKGDILANSNYTDPNGTVSLGLNARTVFMPWAGANFEDAVVISKSLANRLSSQHMYQTKQEWDGDYLRRRSDYMGLFPTQYKKEQFDKMDANGVVKKGQTVAPEDPLILAAKPRTTNARIYRKGKRSFTDASVTWDHQHPGLVTDVFDDEKGTTILVKTIAPAEEGDKLSARQGNKGVIAKVLPDDQMPILTDGGPAEMVFNSPGVISRTNPGQVAEAVLGKVARKTGEPYKKADFEDISDSDSLMDFAFQEAKKNGVDVTGFVTDPSTGKVIKNYGDKGILQGDMYVLKLHHTTEAKSAARSFGRYTQDETPAKGGKEGSKRVALMHLNALVSHGAYKTAQGAAQIRGQKNDDYWMQFMSGYNPPSPKTSLVYDKFLNHLKGAGIHVVPEGGRLNVMAMTDDVVKDLAKNRKVKSGETIRWEKNQEPVTGGLFDPAIFGKEGNQWGYIEAPSPVLNPVMEEPTRRLLELTQQGLQDVIAGEKQYGSYGTGSQAIQKALADIDLDQEILTMRNLMKGDRKGARDTAIRKLKYLKTAKDTGVHPSQWFLNRIPVLPPKFRPVSEMSGGTPLVADANYLYKMLIDSADAISSLKDIVDDTGEEDLGFYNTFKALVGLTDPTHPKLKEKKVKGLLKHVFGSGSSKFSMVQRQLLGSAVDLVGRGVVAPDPDLDMDSIGIPEDGAWEIYKPFIVRRLSRRGMNLKDAARHYQERSKHAREELLNEMEERPVLLDRAPVLHKWGILAFKPKLVKGSTIRVSPLIVSGFNMDFDGDTSNFQVPVGEEEVKEAYELMLPSKNLISASDFEKPVHALSQEYIAGLYAATAAPNKGGSKRTFASIGDVRRAFEAGELDLNDEVEVLRP